MTLRLLILFTLSFGSVNAQVKNLWAEVVSLGNETAAVLQEDCKPRLFPSTKGVEKKGTIVLLHGFTACPQQYFELAQEHLVKQGYDVYLPLLPGHGRIVKSKEPIDVRVTPADEWYSAPVTDDLDGMITIENADKKFSKFAMAINEMMAATKGEKIIGGLSGGSAVVLKSLSLTPKLYDKAIIKNAFINLSSNVKGQGIAGKVAPQIVWLMGKTGLWINNRGSWKDGCEIDGRDVGRAGYCQFTNSNIAGLQNFGIKSYRALKKFAKSVRTKIQFVIVEEDSSISNKHVIKLYKKMAKSGTNTSICVYEKGTNHEIISRFEYPNEDKFWLDSLLRNYTSFISESHFFQQSEVSKIEKNISKCEI